MQGNDNGKSGRTDFMTHASELRRRAAACVPGGVHSNVRLIGPDDIIDSAKGAHLYSVDGTDYIDHLLGQGPAFLGHSPDFLTEPVCDAIRNGMIVGGQTEREVRAAELLCATLDWADMVRFGLSGTEMVQAALRLARAVTGRRRVIRFEGHYHGWLDNVLITDRDGAWEAASAGQLASHLDDFLVLPWNDADLLADVLARDGEQIAAIIMEPIMINSGVIEPGPAYLERVRRMCARYGIVLIFDEVISGFRLGTGGAVRRYGVTPDLALYGKAIAGGVPVSALAGRVDLMRRIGTGEVNHSGTFNAWAPGMAAVVATLEHLRDNPPYASIADYGAKLMAGLREIGESVGEPLRVEGLPAAFHVSFGEGDVTDYRSLRQLDLDRYADLADVLVRHGVWVAKRGIWFVSAAHGMAELDETLTRFKVALKDWLVGRARA
ncbi:aspartate aminotransferase family protein [Haloechinothrix salitolerans]|uniref:Aspartate aminotransferase family protein n=1 Tax=Haloechinothrix salitolerans TaxID=926830 RepID=A0ABW2C0E0_9PSEU